MKCIPYVHFAPETYPKLLLFIWELSHMFIFYPKLIPDIAFYLKPIQLLLLFIWNIFRILLFILSSSKRIPDTAFHLKGVPNIAFHLQLVLNSAFHLKLVPNENKDCFYHWYWRHTSKVNSVPNIAFFRWVGIHTSYSVTHFSVQTLTKIDSHHFQNKLQNAPK